MGRYEWESALVPAYQVKSKKKKFVAGPSMTRKLCAHVFVYVVCTRLRAFRPLARATVHGNVSAFNAASLTYKVCKVRKHTPYICCFIHTHSPRSLCM